MHVPEWALEIIRGFNRLERKIDIMTQETDDLNAAVTALGTAVTSATAEISTLAADVLAASANGDHDAVEASVAQITTLVGNLNAAVTAATPAPAPNETDPPA